MQQPVKVIHKEHEAVTAFCINKVSSGLMAIATQKELQELDVSLLLNPNTWQDGMNEEADFDVLKKYVMSISKLYVYLIRNILRGQNQHY